LAWALENTSNVKRKERWDHLWAKEKGVNYGLKWACVLKNTTNAKIIWAKIKS
jgi:hypothetical protein